MSVHAFPNNKVQQTNPPNGGGGNDMEIRLSKLETATEYLQRDVKEIREDVRTIKNEIGGIRTTDFRITFGAIIVVALGLAAIMAKGFHWL